MEVKFSEPYSHLLVKDNDDWYLIFFTGGPVELDICVKLNEEEIARVSGSEDQTVKLAREFQRDRSLYDGRRIIPSVLPK